MCPLTSLIKKATLLFITFVVPALPPLVTWIFNQVHKHNVESTSTSNSNSNSNNSPFHPQMVGKLLSQENYSGHTALELVLLSADSIINQVGRRMLLEMQSNKPQRRRILANPDQVREMIDAKAKQASAQQKKSKKNKDQDMDENEDQNEDADEMEEDGEEDEEDSGDELCDEYGNLVPLMPTISAFQEIKSLSSVISFENYK